jgi:DNA invertase Pin-like site-specific DNA recombinase
MGVLFAVLVVLFVLSVISGAAQRARKRNDERQVRNMTEAIRRAKYGDPK